MTTENLDQIERLRQEIATGEHLNEMHENHSPHYSQNANLEYRARQRMLAEIKKQLSTLATRQFGDH